MAVSVFPIYLVFLLMAAVSPASPPAPLVSPFLHSVAGLVVRSDHTVNVAVPPINKLLVKARILQQAGPTEGPMALIPGGKLTACDRFAKDGKCEDFQLKPYLIDTMEVSTAQFASCIKAGVCTDKHFTNYTRSDFCNLGGPNRSHHPVNCVSFFAARQYCAWVGKRLPTLREWQFAARGETNFKFPWGDDQPDCDRASFHGKKGRGCGANFTSPVDSHADYLSPLGLWNMAGNVMEWTAGMADLPDDDPEGKEIPIDINPRTKRFQMGGSFADEPHVMGVDYICFDSAKSKTIALGIRCARDVEGE